MIPLPAENVDTDQIVPARYLKVTDKYGLAERAVPRLALRGGRLAREPRFVIDQPEMAGPADPARRRQLRRRLVARARAVGADRRGASGRSSRRRFADIFRNNCAEERPAADRRRGGHSTASCSSSVADHPDTELTVDLEAQVVHLPGDEDLPFEVDPFARMMLLAGTDEIGYLLGKLPEIEAWEAGRPARVDTVAAG